MADKSGKDERRLTRRNFIKGAAATGVSAAAFAGFIPRNLQAAPIPKEWDKESDVVVVGGGGAGLLAAIETADTGASTILLETEPVCLGSSGISGGIVTLCETEIQPGSRDELYADLMEAHHQDCNPEMVRAYVNNAPETYKRMKQAGVKFERVSQWAHMKKPWGHDASSASEMVKALESTAKKKGVEILRNTRGNKLIVNSSDRVVGIQATRRGRSKYYGARKAVVVTTGGFTRNPALAKNFGRPESEKIVPLTGIGSRGDGLIMSWALGSDMAYMCQGVGPTGPAEKETGATAIAFYAGAMIVNKNGKRFYRESEVYSDITLAGLQQPDVLIIQLYDSKIQKAFEGSVLGKLCKGAKVHHADTLKDLGAILKDACGLDADTMVETVNKYNGYVDAGFDPEFGRKNLVGTSGKLMKLDTPPFYAMISVPGTTHFNGGLKVNTKMQVLNVFGEIIPGLYAAGEVTGGFHGAGYMSGSALGMAVIYGRIAGMNAAKEVKSS